MYIANLSTYEAIVLWPTYLSKILEIAGAAFLCDEKGDPSIWNRYSALLNISIIFLFIKNEF